ncbi:hypothetical protein BP00DRAFT_423692 [Aspergillus indologenus CBS 114.80]|uniref:Uncharacterized protein n=1 Tax=Aspergillus indologenus CBS 114.80 TaxID=1450541 RepID=A0A2V5ICS6_9EURO|nr:hypothetical protein BP00DRAFT_423692 [Aspergillus indologenus CBS 114.80]
MPPPNRESFPLTLKFRPPDPGPVRPTLQVAPHGTVTLPSIELKPPVPNSGEWKKRNSKRIT